MMKIFANFFKNVVVSVTKYIENGSMSMGFNFHVTALKIPKYKLPNQVSNHLAKIRLCL